MKNLRTVQFTVLGLILIFAASMKISAADGDLDTFFNAGVTGSGAFVSDIAVQPDGKIIIGGNFYVVNGRSYNCLARLNTDGSLDTTFNIGLGASNGQTVGCNGGVNAVAVQIIGGATKILVGGDFSNFGSTDPANLRGRLARLNEDGSLDTSFIGVGPTGPSGIVDDIVVQPDNKILIASFNMTQYNGTPVGYIARVAIDGSLDMAFNTNLGAGFNSSTKKIVLQTDGKILVGGTFQTVSGTSSRGIARLNSNGSVDAAFATNIGTGAGACSSCGAFGIAVQPADGKIVIAGAFSDFNSTPRLNLARLNSNGTLDAAFTSPVINTQVLETVVLQPDGKIIVAGGQIFFDDGTTQRSNVARLNPATGSIDPTFNIGTSGANGVGLPSIFLQTNGKVLLGGGFTGINNKARLGFARLETNGDLDSGFTPVVGTQATVKAIAIQPDNKILLGGDFYGANGSLRPRLTRLNPDGTTDFSFNPGAEFVLFGDVDAIALQPDGKIIIGGTFTSYGGMAAHAGIARLNSDGSIDPTFTAETLGVNEIVVQPDGKIIIGGAFGSVNGVLNFTRIARLTPTGALDPAFTATGTGACTCWVEAVALQPDGKILVGGAFNAFNGVAGINHIVRLNAADGSIDAGFTAAIGTGFDSIVTDIDIQPADNKILVTGWFSNFNGTSRVGLARLLTTGALDGSFTVGVGFGNVTPDDLALTSGGSMVVVGSFSTYQGVTRRHIVRILSTGVIDPSFDAGFYDGAETVAIQGNGKTLVGGGFVTYGNAYGTARIGFARLKSGTSTALFGAPFDFDGDGKTDISIFRPAPGQWWYQRSSDNFVPALTFGTSTDKLVPADYTGDGKTDIAFWQPATGFWFILRSEDLNFFAFPFGASGDIPVPADYDGDGKADAAVFRPSNNTWFINKSAGGVDIIGFGAAGDKPTVGDYDGDGKADIAIYRPVGVAGAEWWIRRSSNLTVFALTFGIATDKPVQGDYTRDGKTDVAFWRPSTGEWFVLRSQDFNFFAFPFGAAGDTPAPGDYDGDGQFDAAVFRPATNTWFINRTSSSVLIQSFGIAADSPVPNVYVP